MVPRGPPARQLRPSSHFSSNSRTRTLMFPSSVVLAEPLPRTPPLDAGCPAARPAGGATGLQPFGDLTKAPGLRPSLARPRPPSTGAADRRPKPWPFIKIDDALHQSRATLPCSRPGRAEGRLGLCALFRAPQLRGEGISLPRGGRPGRLRRRPCSGREWGRLTNSARRGSATSHDPWMFRKALVQPLASFLSEANGARPRGGPMVAAIPR